MLAQQAADELKKCRRLLKRLPRRQRSSGEKPTSSKTSSNSDSNSGTKKRRRKKKQENIEQQQAFTRAQELEQHKQQHLDQQYMVSKAGSKMQPAAERAISGSTAVQSPTQQKQQKIRQLQQKNGALCSVRPGCCCC